MHDMVAVRDDSAGREDIYITGGIEVDSFERHITTDKIIRLPHGGATWELYDVTLITARHGHRSWVTYAPIFDEPVIWSVGGVARAGSDVRLEWHDVKLRESGEVEEDGTFDARNYFDIMVFVNGKSKIVRALRAL